MARTTDDVYDDPTPGDKLTFFDNGDTWCVEWVTEGRVGFCVNGRPLTRSLSRAEWAERPDCTCGACSLSVIAAPAPLTLEGGPQG